MVPPETAGSDLLVRLDVPPTMHGGAQGTIRLLGLVIVLDFGKVDRDLVDRNLLSPTRLVRRNQDVGEDDLEKFLLVFSCFPS